MRIRIIIKGRSWLFQLANSLNKSNNLEKLVTTYPKFFTKNFHIPNNKVNSVIFLFGIEKFLSKFINPLLKKLKIKFDPMVFIDWLSDLIFSLFYVKNADYLLVGFGASACKIIKKAKIKGIKTIYFLNSSSSGYQINVKNEYDRLGLSNKYYKEPKVLTDRIEKSIKTADYIGALSTSQKQTYIDDGLLKNKKIFLNLMGVDTSIFYPTNKKKEKFIIITVGNNFVRKGLKYLLESFNDLNLSNSELWIVGDTDINIVNQLVKVEKNNIFKGIVNEFNLPNLYNQSSVFCLPSFEEGLPIVIPQAMACGLPVISSHFASDIVKNGEEGFIVNAGDKIELSKKIKYFYDNPEKIIEMGTKARKTSENLLSYDNLAERILNFCKNEDNPNKI